MEKREGRKEETFFLPYFFLFIIFWLWYPGSGTLVPSREHPLIQISRTYQIVSNFLFTFSYTTFHVNFSILDKNCVEIMLFEIKLYVDSAKHMG